ncbi:hypothetical protein SAMN03159362_0780 [Pseudomonas sp. NFIX51]|jgi:hypothetical protein|nr:hypothetical protein SAMN03159414_0038 [Pseudomonas sp. NFACC41-3]SMH34031.1 hypothetical protein SAMN03159362_0780 [Pseudomonas sp. NFIX51]
MKVEGPRRLKVQSFTGAAARLIPALLLALLVVGRQLHKNPNRLGG